MTGTTGFRVFFGSKIILHFKMWSFEIKNQIFAYLTQKRGKNFKTARMTEVWGTLHWGDYLFK